MDKTGIIAAAIGFAVFKFMPPDMSAMLLGGALAGAACGIVPALISNHKHQKLGGVSLVACAVAGMIGGVIVAIPTALVLSAIAYFKKPPTA